jgi:lactoylglutathione lyase
LRSIEESGKGSVDNFVPLHIGLCVTNVERSLRFYCEGLGFERAERYDLDESMFDGLGRALEVEGPVRLQSQMLTRGQWKIELLGWAQPETMGTPSQHRNMLGFTHLSLDVDDVDSVAARLVALGGTILESTRARLGFDVLFVADPDGTRIELMAPPR